MKLLPVIFFLLVGCTNAITACPPPIRADEKVQEEMATIPFEGYEDTWDYLALIDAQQDQLDECQ